jgi:hypothetical protein
MRPALLALAISAAFSAPSFAAPPASRIEALEARMQALEQSLAQTRAELEALKAGDAATPPADASVEDIAADVAAEPETGADAVAATSADVAAAPETQAASGAGNANAFNPAISIILNASASSHSLDPDAYERSGFPLVGEGVPSSRGISLGESEISFAANIDDKFYGQLSLAIGSEGNDTELGVEEAFIDTTALPGGLTVRAGRFFSNIGYLNSHHAHTDKFFDRPLPYQAFLGNQYGDDGVQLRWVAPTDTFIELGGEVFRGDRFAGGEGRNGVGTGTLFAHMGGDIGSESSWLAGVSMLQARTDNGEDGFSGDETLYVADATWKWAPEGNFKDGGVTLRGEYLLEHRDGDYANVEDPSLDQPWHGTRSGAYVEGTWRLNRNWEAGARYDWLNADDTGPYAAESDPSRESIAISWLNSEFSLFRLQYSHDQPNAEDDDNSLTLQYQVSMGAHGAHKF